MGAAFSFGKPNIPVEMGGMASVCAINFCANSNDDPIHRCNYSGSAPSPQTGPTAWIIKWQGRLPELVKAG